MPTQAERASRGERAAAMLKSEELGGALRFIDSQVQATFANAKSPEQAWYARCMKQVADDFKRLLQAYMMDGENAAKEISRAQATDAPAVDPVAEYLRRATEARAAVEAIKASDLEENAV